MKSLLFFYVIQSRRIEAMPMFNNLLDISANKLPTSFFVILFHGIESPLAFFRVFGNKKTLLG